jgi:adenylate kinase family enzyme
MAARVLRTSPEAAGHARAMRKVVIVASASGSGKTTVGRALAQRLRVPFVELDALHHGPGWTEASAGELRARVEPVLEEDGWVIDGGYRGKLGNLVFEAADTVVWLDLPHRVWLPRLLRRTLRRLLRREELWAGNRESIRGAFIGRNALVPFALRNYRRRRRTYPVELGAYNLVRLRSQRKVEEWLESVAP